MIAIISPSKDLNYKSPVPIDSEDLPRLLHESNIILEVIRKKNVKALMKLMNISEKLAHENMNRFQNFSEVFNKDNSRPSIFAFSGDVYRGLDAYSLTSKQINFAQNHIRILSGFYGLLRPLDLIQAYRLEMGLALRVSRKKNLYNFWGTKITALLKKDLDDSKSKTLINLASKEYSDALQFDQLNIPVIQIHFREYKKNGLKFVSFTAKIARGLFARFMILENVSNPVELKQFNFEHYTFAPELSSATDWYFVR